MAGLLSPGLSRLVWVRIGVDTGGTFTDFVFWDGDAVRTGKVRSTPDDPSRAVLEGLGGATGEIVHGSTVATNALLEGRGARLAFVATEGFEDILELGRQNRRSLYDWADSGWPELAAREMRFGVRERALADGSIETPLDSTALDGLATRLRDAGAESVAVCLLHSYAAPEHERLVGEVLRAAGFFVSLSHEVLPEYREYERAATTAVNAAVSPVMGRYLSRLEAALPAASRLRVFQSTGASMSASAAGRLAVQTVLSGPAGGVLGAALTARAAGFERFIAFDMGGTSTDVSLYDGRLGYTNESELGGFPIRVATLDIHSVGAGGGSIAWFDAGGALRVGPRSAGADPGPVCYGKGEEVTVTDANLLLGRIDADRFLSGRMTLDVDRAARAMEAFGRRAGVSADEAARAIVRVANANMERALRAVSVERGLDPRDFALVAFGGAGGQHACELAELLEIGAVVVPREAGVLSALGMLSADFARDYSQSVVAGGPEATFRALEARARAELSEEGAGEAVFERSVDLRYAGQSFEITLPWAERSDFDSAHRRLYGYDHAGREVEAVTARLRAVVPTPEEQRFRLRAEASRETFSSLYAAPGWQMTQDDLGARTLRRAG